MDASINAAGFKPFTGTTIPTTVFYAEFMSSGASSLFGSFDCFIFLSGPGGNTSGRVAVDQKLTSAQAANFTVGKVFGGVPAWIDSAYVV